jgi:cell division protein FtsI (penicillin-binding protein 3)
VSELVLKSLNPGFVKLKVGADETECRRARRICGAGVVSEWNRHWPAKHLTSHVVGFTSVDNRGLGGIELICDEELRGAPAENVFFADAFRRSIALKKQNGVLKDGAGIILTIDAAIQQFARAELTKRLAEFRAESAVAIVAEPKTGAILAIVSLPDYDPEQARFADANNLRNRALTDQYEPGSILKPIAAAIALDAGVVNTSETIFCEDGFYSGKGFGKITEYRNYRYGNMTLARILIKSSNIGMAKIGQRIGAQKLYEGLKLFGFGRKTGIDLPGEAGGLLRSPGAWTGYSVTRIPFGQEISVTAIQLVRAFCVLANGGRAVKPHLVRAMVDYNGEVIKAAEPENGRVGFVVKPEVARWVVTEALVGVVNEGTGRRAKLKKWQVFGKTGTANIAKENERGYSDQNYVASFIAGAPAEDPAVICLVSIRKPDKSLGKGYTGGRVASPAVAAILEKTLTYLKVPAR